MRGSAGAGRQTCRVNHSSPTSLARDSSDIPNNLSILLFILSTSALFFVALWESLVWPGSPVRFTSQDSLFLKKKSVVAAVAAVVAVAAATATDDALTLRHPPAPALEHTHTPDTLTVRPHHRR